MKFLVGIAALSIVWSGAARAEIIRLDYDATGTDPAADFAAACLGTTPADDCDTRAALLEADLVTVLSRLESDSDPRTAALFQTALDLDSPIVQTIAVQYLSRMDQQPTDFMSKVKTFFMGPDAPLGVAAAEVVGTSTDSTDKERYKLYHEGRSASDYEPADNSTEDRLLSACTKDARLNLMTSFDADEQFAPADRLLMYDRFVRSPLDPMTDYPVTSFITDASVDEVSAFFTKLFGKPYGPIGDVEAQLQQLNSQLIMLSTAAAQGDMAAIAKLKELSTEITRVQQTTTLATVLQLSAIHADKDVVWVDGDLNALFMKPLRAVTVGQDALLGKTIIRYVNQPVKSGNDGQPGSTADGGTPGSDGNGGTPGFATDAGNDTSRGSPRAAGGCGCTVPGAPGRVTAVAVFPVLALLIRRTRRRARR
jgi:hypothetical protein